MERMLNSQFWMEALRRQRGKAWVRVLVVAAVLGFSALVAATGSQDAMTGVLFLLASLVGLAVLLQWPVLILFGGMVGGFFSAYVGPGGVNVSVFAIAAAAGFWVMDMVIRQKKVAFAEPRTTIAVLLFSLSALISFVAGLLPWYPLAHHAELTAQLGGLSIFLLSGIAFLLMGHLAKNLRWLEAFTWLFLFIGALQIVGRFVPRIGHLLRPYFQYPALANSVFWVWLLVIPFSQALLNKKLSLLARGVMVALCASVLYVSIVLAYDWKSGFIPPLAGVAVIVALVMKRRVFWFLPAGMVVAAAVASQAISSDEYSWFSRLEAWQIVLELAAISPIFGVGFSNYYWYTPLTEISGYHVSFNSHSQYVDILAQTGIVGMLAFLYLCGEIFYLGWKLKERAPEGFAKAYVYGAMGGLAGMLVAGGLVDWVLPFVYNIGMNGFRSSVLGWLFLGGLVVIHQAVEKNGAPETNVIPEENK